MKRFFSLLLALVLVACLVPTIATAETGSLRVEIGNGVFSGSRTFTNAELAALQGDAFVFSYTKNGGVTLFGKAQGVALDDLLTNVGLSLEKVISITFTDYGDGSPFSATFTQEDLLAERYAFDGDTNKGVVPFTVALSDMTGCSTWADAEAATMSSDYAYRDTFGQTAVGEVTAKRMVKGVDAITILIPEEPDLKLTVGDTSFDILRSEMIALQGEEVPFSYATKKGSFFGKAQGVTLSDLFAAYGVPMYYVDTVAFTDMSGETPFTRTLTAASLFADRYVFDGETNLGSIEPMLACTYVMGVETYAALADTAFTNADYRNVFGQEAVGDTNGSNMVSMTSVVTVTLKPITKGDVSLDGAVTSSDAAMLLRSVVGLDTLSTFQRTAALFTADDAVTAADATAILRTVVGLG